MHINKKRDAIHFCLLFVLLLYLFVLNGCNQIIPPVPDEAKWTVMVYMASDNNLESVGIEDFNEMEMAGSTADVNIVLQIDRIPFDILNQLGQGIHDDSSEGNWTGTRRYYVTQDMNPNKITSTLKADLGEQNMGDVNTLKDFAQWVIQNYPAQHYMLVLWDHGGGFRSLSTSRDICWDMTDSQDKITMDELEEAMAFIYSQLGQKIELIGMDACFMGMTEVAYQIGDYAQVMVASEASVPEEGWQYDCILQNLITYPEQTAEELASKIIDCYGDYYVGRNVTLSAVDLNQMDSLANHVSLLAQQIINDPVTPKSKYSAAANASQHYTGTGFEYIDLKDFVNRLSDYTSKASVLNIASQINQSLKLGNIIIGLTNRGSGLQNSHGLSIYFPYYSYDDYYDHTNFARDTLWDEMLLYLGY